MGHVNYSCLRGRVTRIEPAPSGNPHLWLLIEDEEGKTHFATINVLSSKGDEGDPVGESYLYFSIDNDFRHPIVPSLSKRPAGMSPQASSYAAGALDYVKGNLLDPRRMRILPPDSPGHDDLVNRLTAQLTMARDGGHDLLIFGSRFRTSRDQTTDVLGETPELGIDNIHMAQGDPRRIENRIHENGRYHDGGMFIVDRNTGRVTAIFLGFQSQSWQTDENGQPLPGRTGFEPPRYAFDGDDSGAPTAGPSPVAQLTSLHKLGDGTVSLVVANMSNAPVALDGWTVVAGDGERTDLGGAVRPGVPLPVGLDRRMVADDGGILSLLDPNGLKVDGVAYLGGSAGAGWSTSFDL